jgi:hypothetical protein
LLHAIHSHHQELILSPQWFSWTLEIPTATAKSHWGLALNALSLCLPLKVKFSFLLNFIYINKYFSHKKNYYKCIDMVSEIHTKQSINEENSSLFINSLFL